MCELVYFWKEVVLSKITESEILPALGLVKKEGKAIFS